MRHRPHGLAVLIALGMVFFVGKLAIAAPPERQEPRPNVLLIMTDDQGYADLSCHGNPVLKTPNLDALHAESVRFTNFHVDPTCAPTRSALMTGRYSGRVGVWHTIMGRSILRTEETTMAEVFRAAGYATGIFGKWHLGDNYPFRPGDQGFDESLVHGGGGVGQVPDYWGNDYFDDTFLQNGTARPTVGYCTDLWFEAVTQFIDTHKDEPFFAYLPTNAPHSPYLVPESYVQPYAGRNDVANPEFYGMIACIDENIGRLMEFLKARGLEQDTIVLFMTDNGSAGGFRPQTQTGYNAGMRGMKGSQYEGGHRVPCFVRWPGGGIAGGKDVTRLAAHFDLLPTLAELCGVAPPNGVKLDGKSLAPLLREPNASWPERSIVVESQRIETPEKWRQCAVMTDRYRLVNGKELYDLSVDPGQHKDIASQQPEVVRQLRQQYETWWADVSTGHAGYARIPIGLEDHEPVRLTCHDWHGDPALSAQEQIQKGVLANGFWALEVRRPGRYAFELRRWPAEDPRPISDGTTPSPINARLEVGSLKAQKAIEPDAVEVTLEGDLPAGPAQLQTWFEPPSGSRGAYYVYVRRVGDAGGR